MESKEFNNGFNYAAGAVDDLMKGLVSEYIDLSAEEGAAALRIKKILAAQLKDILSGLNS
jgi:hypothetical protein